MDQNDRFGRFDQTDFSRFESTGDRDRSPSRSGGSSRSSARPVRSGMRMGKGRPMRKPVKINYRLMLCVAVLVFVVLTIIFGVLSSSEHPDRNADERQGFAVGTDRHADAGEPDPSDQHHCNAARTQDG